MTTKSAPLTAAGLVVPSISPARKLGLRVSTAFLAFSASRDPMITFTPGAPRRSANAPPRFPVPPTIATANAFSIRPLEMAKKIFPLGAKQFPHRSLLLLDLTPPHDNYRNAGALSHD